MISTQDKTELHQSLKLRFEQNMQRHMELNWESIQKRLEQKPDKLDVLYNMESTGGEPDVVGYDKTSDEYIFFDCSKESPSGRRSICYDAKSRLERKVNQPQDSALEMASKIGIEILDEEKYRFLQTLGDFDLKTSSWIQTPDKIRKLGGALFCDKRYNTVFTYHNGAESYYASRGFRGLFKY